MSQKGDKTSKNDKVSISRVYQNVNESKPTSYYDYEHYSPTWMAPDPYEIVRKVGRGKYSEVFEGLDTRNNGKVIIKILKPVKKRKIKREIRILKNLTEAINVVKLLDTCRDPNSKTYSLIFEYVDTQDFKTLFPTLTDMDVRYYLLQLLMGLDDSHARGIVHRDVKPHNVMIDHKRRELRIIDWGLAEFYHPRYEYNVRVASRYFKGPELLTDMRYYDYSLDLWSFGCMMAGMIFIVHPFFHGKDNDDQLVRIVRVLGTDLLKDYLKTYGLKLSEHLMGLCQGRERMPWVSFRTKKNKHLCPDVALDLLNQVLVFDHQNRLTCKEAMKHPYFDPVRAEVNASLQARGLGQEMKTKEPSTDTHSDAEMFD